LKQISLTQGKFALIDDADYEWLNQWKWHACRWGRTFYARRLYYLNRKQNGILMHREILKLKPSNIQETDHIDGNGLNNQRVNLRSCTKGENRFNSKPYRNSSSRFKGVSRHSINQKWRASITKNGKFNSLGCFIDEVDAARAYDEKAKELFGDFARLNFNQGETYANP
jgi:hypothetical protein